MHENANENKTHGTVAFKCLRYASDANSYFTIGRQVLPSVYRSGTMLDDKLSKTRMLAICCSTYAPSGKPYCDNYLLIQAAELCFICPAPVRSRCVVTAEFQFKV